MITLDHYDGTIAGRLTDRSAGDRMPSSGPGYSDCPENGGEAQVHGFDDRPQTRIIRLV